MYTNEELVDAFLENIRYLNVVHHVKGRIRVKASLSGAKKLAEVDPDVMEEVISSLPGITSYRVNKKALSVIIEYNSKVLPYNLWEQVGELNRNPGNLSTTREQLLAILNG